jgi:hypothetical protein
VVPIQAFMPAALSAVLKRAPLTPEKTIFAWRMAVGPALASVTAVELSGTVLHVAARDGTWQREVKRAAPLILARLTSVLGEAVTRLDVKVVPVPGQAAGEPDSGRRRR